MNRIAFIFLLFSCTEFDVDTEYYITPELKPYVDQFYIEAINHNILLPQQRLEVRINNLEKWKAIGLCWNNNQTVLIDDDYYQKHSQGYDLELEAVVFHELGHALLNRKHSENWESLMAWNYCRPCYAKDPKRRFNQINELFKPITK